MKAIIVGVEENDIQVKDIPNELHELQALVDGYIEPCALNEFKARRIEMLANEEGLLKGLQPNPNLFPFFYVGTVVFVGVCGDEFTSLSEVQIDYIQKWIAHLKEL